MESEEAGTAPGQIKEGEFREWSFALAEVLDWCRTFLRDAGYEVLSGEYVGLVKPDIHARRMDTGKAYDVFVIGAQHTDTAVDTLTRLAALKSVAGDEADYVMVMPPISEYLLLDFLRQDKGRWYYAMKELKFNMWLANPDEEFVWCVVGEPQDKVFRGMFVGGKMSVDFVLARELAQSRWSEEDD